MSNIIKKRRRIVNGVEITLLEKNTETLPLSDTTLVYSNLENSLKTYITSQISQIKIPETIREITQQEVQSALPTEPLLVNTEVTSKDIINAASNVPEDGSIISYDGGSDTLVWKQSPNVRLDFIDNTILNYPVEFSSDRIVANKFHLPFAVAWGTNNWGGNGRGGIFWGDPWAPTVDNFSIKMGKDDASIGETGYTYGNVGNAANPVIMKFSNGNEGGRGFVWTSVGDYGSTPVMSLDTDLAHGLPGGTGGNLKVKGNIVSEYGDIASSSGSVTAKYGLFGGDGGLTIGGRNGSGALVGNIVVDNFKPDTYGDPVDESVLITLLNNTGLTVANDGYVLTYRHIAVDPIPGSGYSIGGVMRLEPPTGGSGGGTFPGVEIDCGSFLQTDNYCDIDAGSFV